MGWNEKFDALERAALLFGDHVITVDEFRTIKQQILQLDPLDKSIYRLQPENVKAPQVDPYPTSACTNTVTGRPVGSNTIDSFVTDVVEKDHLLDWDITNAPVKKFKDDFERINVGDSPEANYY